MVQYTESRPVEPMGLFIQPACLQHKYIRHANSSHIFERPERLRAVLLGAAAATARLEEESGKHRKGMNGITPSTSLDSANKPSSQEGEDLTSLLSSLSIASSSSPSKSGPFLPPSHITIVPPPPTIVTPGQILLHHPALQLSHTPPPEAPFPYTGPGAKSSGTPSVSSTYMRDLLKWASEAPERIKTTGCEIPAGLGLNQGDLYLGPGSVLAIEGAAIDMVLSPPTPDSGIHLDGRPSTPPSHTKSPVSASTATQDSSSRTGSRPFRKAFCAIRPPGHHCGEDAPSGFCYVNNMVVGAMHAYLEHDIDRAIIIDFDLHHGNGTQALVMPLNAASYAEEIAVKAGKPPTSLKGPSGKRRRGWKGFYGSVHDIYSYPCEDGEIDLVKDASISLAAHGQYIENIHLQPYSSEDDFYTRIYPKYLALLDKAKVFMDETEADPERTMILISAGFDACEHEYQAMQRHDRRVPVSFFSRYTRDIAKFADEHCRGRVVSVLEGGYSDRALTSAAMGHVVGMLGQEGKGEWWDTKSLDDIEKATKKKRTGNIAPMPSEFSHIPHLSRTHALLAHFETIGLPAETPSSQSTPQNAPGPGQRWMTLRARRANGDEEAADTPPPAARRGRGRGAGTPTGTPRLKKAIASPSKLAASSSAPAILPQPETVICVEEVVAQLEKVELADGEIPVHTSATTVTSTIPVPPSVVGTSNVAPVDPAKPIILRFKRPSPSLPSSDPLPATLIATNGLYPHLPPAFGNISSADVGDASLAYRETSVETSTSEEYVTASSGNEEKREEGHGFVNRT